MSDIDEVVSTVEVVLSENVVAATMSLMDLILPMNDGDDDDDYVVAPDRQGLYDAVGPEIVSTITAHVNQLTRAEDRSQVWFDGRELLERSFAALGVAHGPLMLLSSEEEPEKEIPLEGHLAAKKIIDSAIDNVSNELDYKMRVDLKEKLDAALNSAGNDTRQWIKDREREILQIFMVPFYGWVHGPVELSKLKDAAIRHFRILARAETKAVLKAWNRSCDEVIRATFRTFHEKSINAWMKEYMHQDDIKTTSSIVVHPTEQELYEESAC